MRKYISAILIAFSAMTMVSCEKKVDVNAVSAILPGIQLSSVGMSTPGPYVLPAVTSTTPNAIQILFGATTTNKTAGVFDVYVYDSATPTVVVTTLHFASWTAIDSFNANSYGSISYTNVPSTYPNTTIYQGSVLLKYGGTKGAPFVTGKSYNVTATATSTDGVKSSISITKLFTIQ
ncbi:MAG: hypothetical protein EOP45_12430 [Sphingobacteriaceae bacterium]|nr:MAG: hypothetical protein EOP45_12430 [Sphingobacteriaceae bacterium]